MLMFMYVSRPFVACRLTTYRSWTFTSLLFRRRRTRWESCAKMKTEYVVPTSLLITAINRTTDWQLSVGLEGWA
jgi:hypothetical protein